jgi:hypothetical protein
MGQLGGVDGRYGISPFFDMRNASAYAGGVVNTFLRVGDASVSPMQFLPTYIPIFPLPPPLNA